MNPPPEEGWYPDPKDSSKLRFWGAEGWTARTKKSTDIRPTAKRSPASPKQEQFVDDFRKAIGVDEKPEFVIWGLGRALVALDNSCLVVRGRLNSKKQVKGDWLVDSVALSLFYSDINAVQVRPLATKVYLTILTPSFSGEFDPVKVDMNRAANAVMSLWDPGKARIWDSTDEPPDNIFGMSPQQFEEQKRLVDKLRSKVAESKRPSSRVETSADIASQLAQLAELSRAGALTEDEYSAAKKKLLD